MEAIYNRWQNPYFRGVAKLFYRPKVQEIVIQYLLDSNSEEKVEECIKKIGKDGNLKFPKKHVEELRQVLFNELILTIITNVATKIHLYKRPVSEEVVCEELTPYIVNTAISKLNVSTSEKPEVYLIRLWKRIKTY